MNPGADDPGLCMVASEQSLAHAALRVPKGYKTPELPAAEPASRRHEARQPSRSRIRRALASIRFSPADRPRLASCPARSRTTSTTLTRSPDASFSRFALYRWDQLRSWSPPLSTVTPQPISKPPGSHSQRPKLVPRMTGIEHTVMPRTGSSVTGRWCWPARQGLRARLRGITRSGSDSGQRR